MMSLLAARCMFRTVISGKHMNSVSLNITFMTLQCHKVQSKCLQTNFATVSRKINHTSKRRINVSAMSMMSKSHYDVLGVPKSANQKEIKDAYYKLAMKYHPDKNQGNLTQEFREIKEAYDILGNESSRKMYDKNFSNTNYSSTSSNWTSNSSDGRYQNPYGQYTYTYTNKRTNNRTQYKRTEKHTYNYDHLKPFNVFINIIKVPKNVIKTQVDIMLLTFIKNRTLKLILFQLFQLVWNQVLKSLNFNVLISSSAPDSSLGEFIKSLLGTNTVRIELTELDAYKGKSVRINVNDHEKVLVVNIPRGVKKNDSFYLFYLVDDDDNDAKLKN